MVVDTDVVCRASVVVAVEVTVAVDVTVPAVLWMYTSQNNEAIGVKMGAKVAAAKHDSADGLLAMFCIHGHVLDLGVLLTCSASRSLWSSCCLPSKEASN